MGEGITITVTMERDGSVNVSGPLNNPVLCYGLLESGKIAVQKFVQDQSEKHIIEPPPGLRIVNPPELG